MAQRFKGIKVGDQLEKPASRGFWWSINGSDTDPNKIVSVAVVTHIWFDPVEGKEYIAFARLKADGTHGKPEEKRTARGLATCGWFKAKQDWIEKLSTIKESYNVLPMFGKRVR